MGLATLPVVIGLLGSPASLCAQATPVQRLPTIVNVPPAAEADVGMPEAIVAALYDVISGGVGENRDWNRMRSLFVPGGRLIAVNRRPDGSRGMGVMTVDEYIALAGPFLIEVGFREREIASTTERFGHIAHVFSTYEAFRGQETEPFMRGINSIQLMSDGGRWWIVTVFWEAESAENPIPARYLP